MTKSTRRNLLRNAVTVTSGLSIAGCLGGDSREPQQRGMQNHDERQTQERTPRIEARNDVCRDGVWFEAKLLLDLASEDYNRSAHIVLKQALTRELETVDVQQFLDNKSYREQFLSKVRDRVAERIDAEIDRVVVTQYAHSPSC